ncbi:MAG: hypothetical protein HN731_07630 [Rhodospirillaceae bacterium]|nr:hypothetical protein [Rhodospirillaceae bacterium]
MDDTSDLTSEMEDEDRRGENGRRLRDERRRDSATADNWPAKKERRSGSDRRAMERRQRCMHCGKTYKIRTMGQPQCECRLRAIRNPGGI